VRGTYIISSVVTARFVVAVLAAAAIILSAPFISIIRNAIRETFPGHFVLILGIIIGGCIAAALLAALLRIRDRRLFRYGMLAAALALAAAYSLLTSSPDPNVAIVERFHFVEYGFLTLLFYRTWRPLDDRGVLILPVLAAMLTATVEEWFQWFIPGRVGTVEDVFLNWVAILCGLLFAIGLDPPTLGAGKLGGRSRRHISRTAALFVIVFGLFFDSVHIGHRIDLDRVGSFTSLYDGEELRMHARDRAQTWPAHPPIDKTRLAREDQYRTEGIQHVRERNRAWDAGEIDAASRENAILEEYYAPVLDTGHRWPAEQRRDAETRTSASPRATPYVSPAYPYPVFTWRPLFWWIGVIGAACVILLAGPGKR
jgi:VanZ family protein